MVYIIKKKKGDNIDAVAKRTAALMINMEYGLEIYNIHNGDVIRNTQPTKKFNTVDYEFFTDTYLFNCGSIILLLPSNANPKLDPIYTCIVSHLAKFTNALDVPHNTETNKPISLMFGFQSTRYTTIWEKMVNIDNRLILWNETDEIIHYCSHDKGKYTRFIWNVCPSTSLSYYLRGDASRNYKKKHRSLSTIIVDLSNWINCDENMQIISDNQIIIKNNNIPLPKQLWYKKKKILLTPINIDRLWGIDSEIQSSYTHFAINYHTPIALDDLKIFFQPYEELKLHPVNERSSLQHILKVDDIKLSEKNLGNKNVDKITKYNICNNCLTPLFDEFYAIEKINSKNQFAFCKICLHTFNITDYEKSQFILLRSKIPRTREQVIDIMKKPKKLDLEDFPFYKAILKIIHNKFPKKIDHENIVHTTAIQLTNEIVLINRMPNFWKYTEYFHNTEYKAVISIILTD